MRVVKEPELAERRAIRAKLGINNDHTSGIWNRIAEFEYRLTIFENMLKRL